MMQNTYSLVFQPTPEIVAEISVLKERLATKIGWYNSKNSLAHITIGEFVASHEQLAIITKQVTRIADSVSAVPVTLEHYGSYPNGAFFIAPNAISKQALVPIMKRFHKEIRFSITHKSVDPHVSIARKLTADKLIIANELFTSVAMHFLCEAVILRRFDVDAKQFEVIANFNFNGNTKMEVIQTSLF
ncbi:2'-5' RNA ligase [Flavobacterium sp. 7E]|uniref:2'-5' RNA ligase family protein n=1 Tax=Flavobacterium sp. 7E TaxID=2735898 RepID=UPI0020C67DF0|nr:2'-5' RNA ligase family protein [Flavobacterium sp. 7E]NRS90621.1 2'-5' RNA ligase [Flavobacterium sp. 7E]